MNRSVSGRMYNTESERTRRNTPAGFLSAFSFFVLLMVAILSLNSCVTSSLPGLGFSDLSETGEQTAAATAGSDAIDGSAADTGNAIPASMPAITVPPHFAALGDRGISVIQLDGTRMSVDLLSAVTGISGLPATLIKSRIREMILLLDVPDTSGGRSGMLLYASIRIPADNLSQTIEDAGFEYRPRYFHGFRPYRWVMVVENGSTLTLEELKSGLFRLSMDVDESLEDAMLGLIRGAGSLTGPSSGVSGSSGDVGGDGSVVDKNDAAPPPVIMGESGSSDTLMLNFFPSDLAGLSSLKFSGREMPGSPGILLMDAQLGTASPMGARALRSLMRIVLLQFLKDMHPDASSADLRDLVQLDRDGAELVLRDFPLDIGWVVRRFATAGGEKGTE